MQGRSAHGLAHQAVEVISILLLSARATVGARRKRRTQCGGVLAQKEFAKWPTFQFTIRNDLPHESEKFCVIHVDLLLAAQQSGG